MSDHKAAAGLFLLWAGFWRPPDAEFWNELNNGVIDEEIVAYVDKAGYSATWRPSPTFRSQLAPLAVLQSFFIRCFIGIGKKTALPVESVYKKWTEDTSAKLPIAGSTGYLMGDAALHAGYLLEQYRLSVPPDYRMMPDHLALLLELAGFLLEKRTDQEARLFLTQHLDWIDKLIQAVNEIEPENEPDHQAKRFYQLALQLLQQTVNCQLLEYKQPFSLD